MFRIKVCLSFPRTVGTSTVGLLEIILSDVYGPMGEHSHNGPRYFLVFTDNCIRKKFLNTESEFQAV